MNQSTPVITFYFDRFRGFEKTFLPLRDASFFLGENSTGKTSVLAAIQILADPRFWLSGELRHDHIDLGSFRDITSSRQKSFQLGFFWEHTARQLQHVIDANTVPVVFDPTNKKHSDFRPVFDWVVSGKGKIVLGGTTYRTEVLIRMRRFRKLFAELSKIGKLVLIDDAEVDREEARVKALEASPDFDDPHLVALLDVSGCILICSDDDRADRFLKKRRFYARRRDLPKIYRNQRHHAHLLCDASIAPCCQPAFVLEKKQRDAIDGLIGPADPRCDTRKG